MTHSITAVVLYCSLDRRFIHKNISNLLHVGLKIRLLMYDHLWNGEEENVTELLRDINPYLMNTNFKYHLLNWDGKKEKPMYYESLARYKGLHSSSTEHVIFLDGDELVDPVPFKKWLDIGKYKKYRSMKLVQHAYFIKPTYRLRILQRGVVIANARWAKTVPFVIGGRWVMYWNNENKISRWMGKLRLNPYHSMYRGKPFIHHYTCVRSVDNMLTKVENWGHINDYGGNWHEKVMKMFHLSDNKQIGGLRYDVVENKFDIDTTELYDL